MSAKIEGKAFRFELASKRKGEVLTIDATLVGLTDLVEPKDVEAFRADYDKLTDAAYQEVDLASTLGGALGDDRPLVIAALAIALVAGSAFGVRAAFKADAAHAGWGVFHPVSVEKFLLMSACSCGLYSALWVWRCWRWAKFQDSQDIQPFSRALFRVFWLYPLFRQANGRLEARALPTWVGLAAAIGYVAWMIGSAALNRWEAAPFLLRVLAFDAFVLILPTLIAVNRLNGSGAAMRANSRFSWRTAAGAALGIAYTTLIFI